MAQINIKIRISHTLHTTATITTDEKCNWKAMHGIVWVPYDDRCTFYCMHAHDRRFQSSDFFREHDHGHWICIFWMAICVQLWMKGEQILQFVHVKKAFPHDWHECSLPYPKKVILKIIWFSFVRLLQWRNIDII